MSSCPDHKHLAAQPQPLRSAASVLPRRSFLFGAGALGAVGAIGAAGFFSAGGEDAGQLRAGGDPNNWMDYAASAPGPTGTRDQPIFEMGSVTQPAGSILARRSDGMPLTVDAWRACSIGRSAALAMPQGSAGVDLCLILETTASMGAVLRSAQSSLQTVVNSLAATGPNARLAIILHRDYGDDYVSKILPFRPATDAALQTFLASASARGGGDIPEALGPALVEASRLDWSPLPGSVVVVTDAPGHRYDADMTSQAVSSLAGSGRRVSFIDSGAAGQQATAAAAAGAGAYIAWNGDFASSLRATLCA